MPRQPLPKKHHKGPWSIGPGLVDKHAELTAIIGRCIAFWPDVELQMAMLLSVLLKADTEAAIAVYLTLRRSSARYEVLTAAANAVLDDADKELFGAVLLVHQAAEAERNALAHGCWGVADKIDDGILWVETVRNAHFLVDVWSKDQGKDRKRTGAEHEEFAGHFYVYKVSDLEAVYRQIKSAWKTVFDFVGYLRAPVSPPGVRGTRGVRYDQLCASPPIREALRVLRERASRNTKPTLVRSRLRVRPGKG